MGVRDDWGLVGVGITGWVFQVAGVFGCAVGRILGWNGIHMGARWQGVWMLHASLVDSGLAMAVAVPQMVLFLTVIYPVDQAHVP